jgi:hypothetical protein
MTATQTECAFSSFDRAARAGLLLIFRLLFQRQTHLRNASRIMLQNAALLPEDYHGVYAVNTELYASLQPETAQAG